MSNPTTNRTRAPRGRARDDDQEPPPDTAITKSALGDTAIAATGETASTVLAARETAQVQARIMQALARPRVFEEVRERFMADCKRPRFAMVARFHKPQGWVMDPVKNRPLIVNGEKVRNFVKGWSIRAVESAVQAMGNIDATASTIFEDDRKEIVTCRVWDLERNLTWEAQVTVEKTIERKYLQEGQRPLGSRPNSWGDTVYLLPATDDDVRLKRNRLVSMTVRTLGLRAIPGDLLDEFLEPVEELRAKAIEDEKKGVLADPKAALKRVLDNFASIGVRAADIVEFLGGRSIETATPDMILELRVIGADVKAGNYSWRDAVEGSPYRGERATDDDKGEENEAAKAARAKIEATLNEQKKKRAGSAGGGGAGDPAAADAAKPPTTPAATATGPVTAAPVAATPPAKKTREPGED